MDMNYLKSINKLTYTLYAIEKRMNEGPLKGFEDKKAYGVLYCLKIELESAVNELETLSRPALEGKLQENEYGKFELIDENGQSVRTFSCGCYIEVYSDEEREWYCGRVEHTDGHYYFFCPELEHPVLYTGMKARIRR